MPTVMLQSSFLIHISHESNHVYFTCPISLSGYIQKPSDSYKSDTENGRPPFMCSDGFYIEWEGLCNSVIQCSNGDDEDPQKCELRPWNHNGKWYTQLVK